MYKLLILFSLTSCSFLKEYPDDNIVEEITEGVIKSKTGVDVDFTPKSPENLYNKLILRG